jgi:hypothetical protein
MDRWKSKIIQTNNFSKIKKVGEFLLKQF